MQCARQSRKCEAPPESRQGPADWVKLVRKLRWIGLEDEARRLQLALRTVTSEEKCSLFPEPLCVDRVEPGPRPRIASFQREPRSSDN
jgi:hypothetical protein